MKVVTMKGEPLDLTQFKPEDIDLDEVTISLVRQKRYAGRTNHAWSVAQHMTLCTAIADKLGADDNLIKACFLHDIEEGIIQDVIFPIKSSEFMTPEFENFSHEIRDKMMKYLGVTEYDESFVKDVDQIAYVMEVKALRPKAFKHVNASHDIVETTLKLMEVDGIGIPADLIMLSENEQFSLVRSLLDLFVKETHGDGKTKAKLLVVS